MFHLRDGMHEFIKYEIYRQKTVRINVWTQNQPYSFSIYHKWLSGYHGNWGKWANNSHHRSASAYVGLCFH